jgi:hypothetical protein
MSSTKDHKIILNCIGCCAKKVSKEIVGLRKGAPMITASNQACFAKMSGCGLQERLSKKMNLNVGFFCVLRFFSLPYWVISISGYLNNYSAFRLNPVLVSSISSLFSLR